MFCLGEICSDEIYPINEMQREVRKDGLRLIAHTGMSTQSMQALSSLTIGCVDVTIPCSSTYQNSSATFRAFHKCQVSYRPIMHTKFQIWS